MRLKVGSRVIHPIHGVGSVIDAWPAKSRLKSVETENYAVKFDGGGPLGFADHATNDSRDLTPEVAQ